jgi:hypothetical protein
MTYKQLAPLQNSPKQDALLNRMNNKYTEHESKIGFGLWRQPKSQFLNHIRLIPREAQTNRH